MNTINSPRLEQLEQQLHLWLTVPEDIRDPDTLSDYSSLLSEAERERQQRFHLEKDRHSFLVSHALVRKVLSLYVDVDPADWIFSAGEFGRPEIAGPAGVPPLRFNLTHTTGLSACLVTLDVDCGVDAERVGRRGKLQAVAEKMFADSELETLAALNGQQYRQQFFSFWTLREAYCKALGTGIGFSQNDYAFAVVENGRIELQFDTCKDASAKRWQFTLLRPALDYLIAIAASRNNSFDKTISQQYIVP